MDQIHEGKLIVPTGLGPNLSLGYERAQGTYLNSQHNLPADGLLNLGIDIALLQGFWTDESRTLLRQAKASRAVAAVEKQLVLNRLILEATQQYWYWFEAWNKLKVQEKGVKLALERFNGVVESANLGDAPMIDTVEAKIQVQNRMVNYEEFFAQYKINQIELGFYLWEDSLNFVNKNLPPFYAFFDEATLPDFNLDSIQDNLASHPELNEKTLQLKLLDFDKTLAKQYFLPQLDFSYHPLTGLNQFQNNRDLNPNNYKMGLSIKVPIFYRKERGNLKSIQLYQMQTQYDLDQKRREILNQTLSIYKDLEAKKKQIKAQKENVKNSWELLKAEQQKFQLGESSIFMVNTRENKYLKSENKLIELIAKQQISFVKYLYYANQL